MSYVDTLIDDMKLFHDAPIDVLDQNAGIPTWGSGFSFPEAYPKPSGGYWTGKAPHYSNMWFHVGETTSNLNSAATARPWRIPGPYTGNQAPNTRVQVANLQLWFLINGAWQLWAQTQAPGNRMYPINWSNAGAVNNTTWRTESSGGSSVRDIGRGAYENYTWHGWTTANLMPASYQGIASCCYARKVLDNPAGADDRDQAQLLIACAGDYYSELNPPDYDGMGTYTMAMGFGRLKYLTNNWQFVGFYSKNTLSEAQIRANPPPFLGLDLIEDEVPPPPPPPPDPEEPPPDPEPVYPQLPGRSQGVWTPKIVSGYGAWAAYEAIVNSMVRRRRNRRKY